jgi:MHS family shikimate/dehydroshikimate transporter-like MFS transporter
MAITTARRNVPIEGTAHRKRVAIGSAVGTTIENYDFIGYGTAAALYFGPAFFPEADPVTATLLSFATLGIGFAARPLGGIVGGYLGDKIGRKPVLIGSLLVMGIATFLIGMLPTYATIGVLAPILLVTVRVIQGFAFGAEWGGAILMTFEHAPWKKKGQYTAIPQAGFPLGLLLANFAFLASSGLEGDWAWRVPFLLSAILVFAGLYIRLKVEESPEFTDVKQKGEIVKNPLIDVLRNDWRNLLRAFSLRIAETAGYAVAISYVTSYLQSNELATRPDTILAIVIAALIGFPATLLWGRLGDKIGRKPVYIFGSTVILLFGIPLFSTKTRSSGASLAYQLSAVVSGFTAFWAVSLYTSFGWMGPAILFSAYGAVGLVAAILTKETWGPAERAAVDAEIVAHRKLDTASV